MAKSQKLRESSISRYTESVKFKSQNRDTALKRKPYRGLALGSHPRDNGHATHYT